MIGLLIMLGLMVTIFGGLWLFDKYIRSRGGDEWRW